MTKIRIALVDDHVILRRSLTVLIELLEDFEIVLEANNGQELIDALKIKQVPDIVLLDINMPVMNGVETARWLKQNYPKVKILALSMIKNDFVIVRMLRNGAKGYILKDCEPGELKAALHQIYEKGFYYNELIIPKMKPKDEEPDDPRIMFSEQELNFMNLACTEKNHKQIAEEMHISPRTVDGYRDSLFKKLNVNTRLGIALYAIKNGLVEV